MNTTTIDLIAAAILIYGFIRGIMKGLFVEVASLAALVAGIYGAVHFSYFISGYLSNKVTWDENYIHLISFAVTFFIIVLAVSLLGRILTKLADFAFLGWLNKIAGGVFGMLKKALILSVIFLVIERFNSVLPVISQEQKEHSILYAPVRNLLPSVFPEFGKLISRDTPSSGNEEEREKNR